IDKKIAYNGYFQIVRYRLRHTLFAGGWSGEMVREVFERGHAATVLPYDPIRDEVVLIQQFRIGAVGKGDPWLWETVAGIIEPDETPIELVHREAQEEAGCTVADLILMYDYFMTPGGSTETNIMYCGRVDTTQVGGIHGLKEEHEDIQVQVFPFAIALQMLADGTIRSGPAIIALQWLALHRTGVRQQWGISTEV
ncbi:MAG: ADP-ribose diphosphatase, partial [Beggiatoa sp. IS2]